MSELTRRVLTALVLIPAVVSLVLWAPTAWIASIFALIVLAGAWEWARFAAWEGTGARLAYVAFTAGIMAGLAWFGGSLGDGEAGGQMLDWVLGWAIAWWSLALVLVIARQRRGQDAAGGVSGAPARAAIALAGWSVLIPAWATVVVLHAREPLGPNLVLTLLVVIWAADIGAYFGGRRYGRRRLASVVSPGKTWEGGASGLALALVLGLLAGFWMGCPLIAFALVVVITVVVSVLGDLTESLFKRLAGVKDSGGLLPGHGGVLDRIDSLTAGAPLFLLGCIAIGV